MRRLLLVPLFAALTACPPQIDTGNDGGGIIQVGPNGGIFVREGAVLDIPSGAVSSDQIISVTVVDTGIPDVPGRTRVSFGFRFTPSTLTFQQPVTIAIPYDPTRVPTGVDPGTFDMRRNTTDAPYEQLGGGSTDSQHQVVTAQTDRLGMFWDTSPSQPAISSITLNPTAAFLQVGQTQQFTATVTDPAGNPVANPAITWAIVPPRAAKVDQTGLVTALAPGNATLTATLGQASATAPVLIQGSTPGPTSFVHDNPFPTGNDLFGGTLSGTSVFVAGGNGTVLGMSQGTWTRYFSSPFLTLKAIAGNPSTGAVAVGVSGNTGVVISIKSGQTTPTVTTFQTAEPQALWYDGTHGMAVGTGNDVIVLKNGTWTTAYNPSFETLLSVVGDGAGSFTTLGNRGSIYQFDPTTQTWNSLFQTQLAVRLDAAVLGDAAGDEAWGVGGNKLWHFLGGVWTAINLPPTPVLTAGTAIGLLDNQVIVGGDSSDGGYLLQYALGAGAGDAGVDAGGSDAGAGDGGMTGGTWTVLALRGPQVIRGIFGTGSTGYAVGDFGAVWQYGGGTFTELSHGFYGDVADLVVLDATTVLAAVNECVPPGCASRAPVVMKRTGPATWVPLGDMSAFTGTLRAITATGTNDVYAVGDGVAFHFDGTSWMPLTVSNKLYDIEVCGGNVVAVGSQGAVLQGSAGTLAPATILGGLDLYALSCPSSSDRWAAGDFSLFENDLPVTSNTTNPAQWRSVWSPGPGEAFAFGLSPYGVYWDTQNMNVINTPGGIYPNNLAAMWGSSIDNLYAVGDTIAPIPSGYGIRFDGANWTLIDDGAQRNATAVAGQSNLQVWIGTVGGGILQGLPPQ